MILKMEVSHHRRCWQVKEPSLLKKPYVLSITQHLLLFTGNGDISECQGDERESNYKSTVSDCPQHTVPATPRIKVGLRKEN
jgi:hypothetical protein